MNFHGLRGFAWRDHRTNSALLAVALGCAMPSCGAARPPQVALAEAPPAPAPAVQVEPAAEPLATSPAEPVPAEPPPELPSGANAASDAMSLIGDAGRAAKSQPDAVLLVNSARIRAHPWADSLGSAVTSVLSGWNQFMPTDVVDPIRDVDWVLFSGSLFLGSTQQNTFLAHYNLSEARANVAYDTLLKRLPQAKRIQLKVKGAKAISAYIDGASRAFVRPKPGVLAIVPEPEGQRAAELLRVADVPKLVRPGELLRLSVLGGARRLAQFFPDEVSAIRFWLEPTPSGELGLYAEGDCPDEAAASRVVEALRARLDVESNQLQVRLLLGRLLERSKLWQDGYVVRYMTTIEERDLNAARWILEAARAWR